MSIIRSDRKTDFTVLPNALINDERLKDSHLALLVYLLSKPADWWVKIESLKKTGRFGSHDKIVATLKHLRETGYARMSRLATGHTEWVITDEAYGFSENTANTPHSEKSNEAQTPVVKPHSEKPNSEKPNSGNPNVLQKKELDKELSSDKELTGVFTARGKHRVPTDWKPDENCLRLVAKAGIPVEFAMSEVDEFILYWRDEGATRNGWNSTFLNRVKAQWQRKETAQGLAITTPRNLGPSTHRGPGNFRTFDQMKAENTQRAIDEFVYGTTGVTIDA